VILKKVSKTGSCNFVTHSCQFPMEEVLDAQDFNFAPSPINFHKVVGLQPKMLHCWTKLFWHKEDFLTIFRQPKI